VSGLAWLGVSGARKFEACHHICRIGDFYRSDKYEVSRAGKNGDRQRSFRAVSGLAFGWEFLVRGNSKPVTTFAEPGISTGATNMKFRGLAKMVTGNEVSAR
jgi:hypothetical protein